RVADAAARRPLENARRVPAAVGPDQHIGIVVECDALRMFLDLQLDLNIVEIGKHQLAAAHLLEAARLPDLEVALLRMRVEHAVAFLAAEIDGRIEDAPGEAATAAFVAHCQALELCEAGKIADPHASNRLAVLVADQMGGGKI